MIDGYKVFNKGLVNRYGQEFKKNQTYEADLGDINLTFGTKGNGIHFARRLEDCLRYFDGLNEEIDIAKVKGIGNIVESFDEYNGYYELYATDRLYIEKILTRQEIINYALSLNKIQILRFIQGFRLSEFEKELIRTKFNNQMVNKYIAYYQDEDKDVFNMESTSYVKKKSN